MLPEVVGRDDGNRLFETATARPGTTWLLLLAIVAPIIVAFGILDRQAFSVPYQDDYKAILAFATDYAELPTRQAKLLAIATQQYNEYKLSFEHSIVASEMEVTRHLDFGLLIALGNLFLLPIFYLLWRVCQVNETNLNCRLLEFLPNSLIFFSLTYWENMDWAMTGLQNTPVILFGLFAIYLLAPRRVSEPTLAHLLLACISAALAACSSANGFLLGPVGLLILLPRRAFARSLVWCASFALPLASYLYHYAPPVLQMYRSYYITRPLFFFAFFGCVIPSRWPAALLGGVILLIVLFASLARFGRINPAAFYFAVWIVATGALVAWVRGAASFSVASRYSIYSILMLIFCYSFLAEYLRSRASAVTRRRFFVTSLVLAAGMFFVVNLNAYKQLGARRRMVLSGMEFYRANPEANSPMVDPLLGALFPQEKAAEHAILNRAIKAHIYTLPAKQDVR